MSIFNLFKKDNSASTLSPALSLNEMYGKISQKAYKTGNWRAAKDELLKLEEAGCGEASVALGQLETANDQQLALAHFKKAASKGIAEGAWGCAAMLGHDYIADIEGKDKEWYKYCLLAAKSGCCDAMNELGNMFNRINDYLGAYYWYQMAAFYEHPQGYMSAAIQVNQWKQAGTPSLASRIDGVRVNDVQNAAAVMKCMAGIDALDSNKMNEFLQAAMEDDNEFMGLFIGHFFEDTVKMDGNAKMGYQLAAHNNSIIGMKCLGDMLAYGKGCEKNMQNAVSWYKGAAEQGEKTASFIMGQLVKAKNPNLAAYYYSVAYRRGYEPALAALKQL